MRIAAGIILIILVVFGLVALIIDVRVLSDSVSPVFILSGFVYSRIVYGGFLAAAGVLCLKRKYWGLCLATALFALLTGISSVAEPLLRGQFSISMTWRSWILVVGALISTIFISLTKKEWQGNQGLPDSSTSQHLRDQA
jgi:hypothetical protein